MKVPLEPANAPPTDPDEEFFASHPEIHEWLRQALPGEWPDDNELLTSPPFTLAVRVHSRLMVKFGAWRSNANTKNTFVQLVKGRVPVSAYLEYIEQQAANSADSTGTAEA